MPRSRYIVITDLDGTLLDHHTYSYAESLPGLRLLQEHHIPIVFCSAKTRAEQIVLRQALGVRDPFIVENGGAVVWETGYFRQPLPDARIQGNYQRLELARPYSEVRRVLAEVTAELNLPVQGFGDLTPAEVAQCADFDLESATRAMQREYAETVVTPLDEAARERLRAALSGRGVNLIVGARFLSISTANDKGRAAQALADMFRAEWSEVVTVGLGDSHNDAPLLEAVDLPLLVQRPDGTWTDMPVNGLRKINHIGPRGWTQAARMLVEKIQSD